MNAKNKKLLRRLAVFSVVGATALGSTVGLVKPNSVSASAAVEQEEIIYYDDFVYGDDVFNGQGTMTNNVYQIECDEVVTVASALHQSAPSFTSYEPDMHNYCGAMAGRNVVGFYDRWCTNLIPNYTPGMVTGTGIYRYYPDMEVPATDGVLADLYDLMLIGQVGGTTSQNFKNGLRDYVEGKGYSISYSSFYDSTTSVNLTQLTNMINQNKVGVVMCTQYNFIYGILPFLEEGYVRVTKFNSTTAHMMMVYGYQTLAFYNDGNHVCTKTFLYVSSGFEDCEHGYMELNDFSTINEAVTISVS